MTASIVFLDFEASSLGDESWPVEVGYAGACGLEDAFYLSRHSDWSMEHWDRNSATIHGISLADLDEFGVEPAVAIDRLAELGNAVVVSDAPEFENHWLRRISAAAGRPMPFVVKDWESVLPSGQSQDERKQLLAEARRRAGAHHRAGVDARIMRDVWRASWDRAHAAWADGAGHGQNKG